MANDLREKWITRIKLLLGGSRILSLEVEDSEIDQLIDIAYERMKPYTTDTEYITKPYARSISLENDDVEEVRRVIPASELTVSSMSPVDEQLFDFQAYRVVGRVGAVSVRRTLDPVSLVSKAVTPDVNIPFEYIPELKLLLLTEGYTTGSVTIEVTKTRPLEELRDDRALQWIFSYALALTKEVVGRIRSKVKSTNVPIELDGETLINEAASEKQTLEQSLLSDQYGPTIILR